MKLRYLLPLISGLFIWSCDNRTDLGTDILKDRNLVDPSRAITDVSATTPIVGDTSRVLDTINIKRDTLLAGNWRGGTGIVIFWFDAYALLDSITLADTTDTIERIEVRLVYPTGAGVDPRSGKTTISLVSSDSANTNIVISSDSLVPNDYRIPGEIRYSLPQSAVDSLKRRLCSTVHAEASSKTVTLADYTNEPSSDTADSIFLRPIKTIHVGGSTLGSCRSNDTTYDSNTVILWKDTAKSYSYSYTQYDFANVNRAGIKITSDSPLPILWGKDAQGGGPSLIPYVMKKSKGRGAKPIDSLTATDADIVFTENAPESRANSAVAFAAARRAAILSINARPYWNAIVDSTGAISGRTIHTMNIQVPLDSASRIGFGEISFRYTLSINKETTDGPITEWENKEYTLSGETVFPDTVEFRITDPNRFITDTPDTLYLHISPQIRTGSLSGFMKWGSEGNTSIDFHSTVSVLSKD